VVARHRLRRRPLPTARSHNEPPDYGHIGNYEELRLLGRAFGKSLSNRSLYDIYDASLHPREEHPSLNVLDREDADLYLDAVREAALGALETAVYRSNASLWSDRSFVGIAPKIRARTTLSPL
jgi:hypothetical protein